MPAIPVRTPEGDAEFFAAIGRGDTVGAACAAVGYGRRTVYHHRSVDPAFAAAWDEAEATALEEEVDRRLCERYERPVYVRGEFVGYDQVCPDPLLFARYAALRRMVHPERMDLGGDGQWIAREAAGANHVATAPKQSLPEKAPAAPASANPRGPTLFGRAFRQMAGDLGLLRGWSRR